MLTQAILIVARVFVDVTDKSGRPYFLHCMRVMNAVSHLGDEVMSIAIMHDLVEDTSWTPKMLFEMGFSARVVEGVMSMTHEKGVPYMDYIKMIALNKDAVAVKLADLTDNLDPTRLKGLTKKDHDRIEKYHTSYVYLSKI